MSPSRNSNSPIIYWIRNDLRLGDNAALVAAAASGRPVIPLFILDETEHGPRSPGGAARWWLHHSLSRLADDYHALGATLILRRGETLAVLASVARETGAERVVYQRSYDGFGCRIHKSIKAHLSPLGVKAAAHAGYLLFEPEQVSTLSDTPFKVFTPFWRRCMQQAQLSAPLAPPQRISPANGVKSDALAMWQLLPSRPDWSGGLVRAWTPGEQAGLGRLQEFIDEAILDYSQARDIPGVAGTSGLSAHLHFGEISARQIWHAVNLAMASADIPEAAGEAYLRQIGWREFCHHQLFHWPDLDTQPLRPDFTRFPWRIANGESGLAAWQRGQTGLPLVDAGMRQLWTSGWMHNRVRMLTASFLTKNLLLPWQLGEHWFWDTLVDANPANNAAGWQWVAGSGADAAPYFRIFNPVTQSKKFDAEGDYIRRWVPELSALPSRYIHAPWEAPDNVLAAAGVTIGENYPAPIVDLKTTRQRALDAYAAMKASGEINSA